MIKNQGLKGKFYSLQAFLSILILFRILVSWLIPLHLYVILFFTTFFLKWIFQGLLVSSLGLLFAFFLGVLAQTNHSLLTHLIAYFLVFAINYFLPYPYCLPFTIASVGFKQSLIDKIYCAQFFAINTDLPHSKRNMKWAHTIQIRKFFNQMGISNAFVIGFLQQFMSYLKKYQYTVVEGEKGQCKRSILFSHGRGATPFMYSQFILDWARKGAQVIAPQHNQKINTGLKREEDIKLYREKEIIQRANDCISVYQQLQAKEVVLIGHSHGCATVVQTYHMMSESQRKRVTKIILMDPWLFPLSEEIFSSNIDIPVLILGNEDFVNNVEILLQNVKFKQNKSSVQYIIWKRACHLHQTDVGFLIGGLMGRVKHPQLSLLMLRLNLEAIDQFINGVSILEHKQLQQYWYREDYIPLQPNEEFNYKS